MIKLVPTIGHVKLGIADMLEDKLNNCLANTFVMYYKAHSFHWNVEGVLFPQYHAFFGDLYEQMHDAVDEIAEQLRMIGVKAPVNLGALYKSNQVDDSYDADLVSVNDMINSLLVANNVVRASLYSALKEATDKDLQGLVNFLADRIMKHDKINWMLEVSGKGLK